jgi:hypothetical protein
MVMTGAFADLIKNLQDEAEENKVQLIEMLESTSREYTVLNELMNKYIERCDAADILKQESESRRK